MMSSRDPTTMSTDDRLAELSTLLAHGYLRHLTKRRISSAEPSPTGESMALWGQVERNPSGKERA